MSIITEALKRAELDRERKKQFEEARQVEMTIAAVKEETPETLQEADAFLEQELSRISRPETGGFWVRLPGYFILGAIALACLIVLVLLMRWPSVQQAASFGTPPLSAAVSKAGKTPVFVLSGITKFDKDRYAIINNVVLHVGESIEEATVKEIQDNEVVLETRSGELALKLPV